MPPSATLSSRAPASAFSCASELVKSVGCVTGFAGAGSTAQRCVKN
jgi:hypothetical protein